MSHLRKANKVPAGKSVVLLIEQNLASGNEYLSNDEISYVTKQKEKHEKEFFLFNRLDHIVFVQYIKNDKLSHKTLENCRLAGAKIAGAANNHKQKELFIIDVEGKKDETLALAEGMALENYQFLKYFKDAKKKKNSLARVGIIASAIKTAEIETINIMVEAANKCRDLVNEPVASLNAVKLAKEIEKMAKESGARVEVMNKKKIEALKMGGLLAVNRGSIDPPTFTIFEWKPEKPVNKKPIIFVGKGVVFDTGGLNIKTGNYMEHMKCDMGGAAVVSTAVYAIAKAKLPVHVIALVPATDNRPDGNAYAPGDVIHMFDGTTVEVLNTDAEGRMILADALSYAKKYDPELVIDAATLTGAASIAIGRYGIVAMGSDSEDEFEMLKKSGDRVYERIATFPFWDEYKDLLKSEIADLKNIGGREAGAITAGKFLEHFTAYPYIHLDIAGPAHVDKKYKYHGTGGTGIGVRLLFDFIKQKSL
jgi:leucyl aminopeptidase